jgi:hypothetical protein
MLPSLALPPIHSVALLPYRDSWNARMPSAVNAEAHWWKRRWTAARTAFAVPILGLLSHALFHDHVCD